MIEVLAADIGHGCLVCASFLSVYKITLGNISLFLCQKCVDELHRKIGYDGTHSAESELGW